MTKFAINIITYCYYLLVKFLIIKNEQRRKSIKDMLVIKKIFR